VLPHKLLGVIFDLDNTLVSSNLNFDDIRTALRCPKNIDVLDFVDTLPKKQQILANNLLVEFELNDALNTKKLLGTGELIELLSRLGIPCAIVTRNCREAALIKIQRNNIDIELLFTRADHKAKPAPDALLHLAKLWALPVENLLYVGDYLYDLQAAENAQTMSCLVTHGEVVEYASMATIVVNELTELSHSIELTFARETTCDSA
jgi:HAD superfamily hydrolase (TIGR01549 family)|tara:strand:- start:1275 stop:1892 length:618 start_codon:yes stop_codon:yes gene_type:complete